MTPDEYCQEKTQQSSSSFYYSFLFLTPQQRQAMTALYAFCREVDDVVDECSDPQVAASKLNWWRHEVNELFNGQPNHPVARALQISIKHYPLQQDYFQELITGMEMDLHTSQYSDFNALSLYCYRAASVVGLLTIEILGYQNKQTIEYAKKLGTALQLINILRDVKEDAQRGRFYIPQDELKRFELSNNDLAAGNSSTRALELFKFQAQRAEQIYQDAFKALPPEDRYAQRTGIIMAEIYYALLKKIQQKNYPVLEQRVKVAKLKKLWIAWRTARREYRLNLKTQP